MHTITTKPLGLRACCDAYRAAGIPGITVWRDCLKSYAREARGMITDAGLIPVALCRGGFFPALTADARQTALDDNRRAIDEAASIGAPLVVLVCGAVPGQSLAESRRQIAEGIAAVEPHARAAKVRLAIEPLHPMYAADRSAVNTLRQARELCEMIASPAVGIALDVYHCWWDPDLETEIARCGSGGWLAAFHVCDWRVDTRDLLNDRGLMGEGCIRLREIRGWVERAGFRGWIEVEIFSNERWAGDQSRWVRDITAAYLAHV